VLTGNQLSLENPENTAWYLCAQPHEEQVQNFMREQYAIEGWGSGSLRDSTHMRRAYTESDNKLKGWLELNNGFIFTRSEDMYKGLADIFLDE